MTAILDTRYKRGPLIYLASRYSRRAELQGYAEEVRSMGLGRVDCRWLSEDQDWDGGTTGDSLAKGQQYALNDLADLERSHAVVVFTEEAGEYRRGGSLVELGIALGESKHVVIVGPAPNVFCTLPIIPRFATWAQAVAHLVDWRAALETGAVRQRLLS